MYHKLVSHKPITMEVATVDHLYLFIIMTVVWPLQLVSGGGGATMGGVEDEQFQGAGDIEERHDSFDQPPSYNNQKWDEEEEWETEQREDDGEKLWWLWGGVEWFGDALNWLL